MTEKITQHEKRLNNTVYVPEQSVEIATQPTASTDFGSMFKIPDPIKMLPSFNGNEKQLTCCLNTAEETLKIFESIVPSNTFRIYFTAILNKIEGHAKDELCVNGTPSNLSEVKAILIDALGDKKELSSYNCQLWHNRMEGSVDEYYKKNR